MLLFEPHLPIHQQGKKEVTESRQVAVFVVTGFNSTSCQIGSINKSF